MNVPDKSFANFLVLVAYFIAGLGNLYSHRPHELCIIAGGP